LVSPGAGIPVVTRTVTREVVATGHGVAEVGGTGVGVVTVDGPGSDAAPTHALVAGGTWVQVVARFRIIGVLAAQERVAGVVGAWIRVVAAEGNSAGALSIQALVPKGAKAAIITRCLVGSMLATGVRVAPIIKTGVVVVAIEQSAGDTFAIRTSIVEGARIVVIARSKYTRMGAASLSITEVLGARIGIVAVHRDARFA